MKNIIWLFALFILLASCSDIERTRDDLKERAQVYSEDALQILVTAKELDKKNFEIHERSLAQIVFPKAVKGSFIFGGNYAEGYLIENEQIFDQIRMIGGNIGPNIGGQSYSQITYIMDRETLFQIKNGQKFSLQGTASYAKSGQSVTDIFGQISDGQSLVTVIFNQSGYLAGISFEGTYISVKN
jgi:lipid-binding SYLF domain-containing protein